MSCFSVEEFLFYISSEIKKNLKITLKKSHTNSPKLFDF